MKIICKKCGKVCNERVDGYCLSCIKREQKSILSKWNEINDAEKEND